MTLTLVAAVAENGVIGLDGDIPWRLPGEQARFKRLTIGHVLVMGRRTYESIGRPLPGRTTVVITRQPAWADGRPDGVLAATSVAEAIELARAVDDEVFVVGGVEVYRACLPLADRLELTFVEGSPDGDTWFPDVDWSEWHEVAREPEIGYVVVSYTRARQEQPA